MKFPPYTVNQHSFKRFLSVLKYILILFICLSLMFPISAHAEAVSAPALDYSSIFNADYYYNTYPDLQTSIGRDNDLLFNHFLTIGMKEGRTASQGFDVKAYMLNNLDLLPVYGAKDLSSYYIHYITCGKAEGRTAVFDSSTAFPEGTIASFSTAYDNTEDRAVNVELAAAKINGMILQPGDTFSFSKSVESRTLANGYVVAPSIANGRMVTSVGGGICQVSSTLYISVLLAGISPSEHYSHSLSVGYVPIGLDSAIVEGYKDLRFKNTFEYPIAVHAVTKDNVLTVSISQAQV